MCLRLLVPKSQGGGNGGGGQINTFIKHLAESSVIPTPFNQHLQSISSGHTGGLTLAYSTEQNRHGP